MVVLDEVRHIVTREMRRGESYPHPGRVLRTSYYLLTPGPCQARQPRSGANRPWQGNYGGAVIHKRAGAARCSYFL